jgi:hypothetical protein
LNYFSFIFVNIFLCKYLLLNLRIETNEKYFNHLKTKQMTASEFTTIATSRLSALPTNDLIVELKKLMNDFTSAANMVQDIVLDILMERLPESEFIELCNSL